MKRVFIVLLFSTTLFLNAHAQHIPLDEKKYTDSLEHIIYSNNNDSMKARACFNLCMYWRKNDMHKAFTYLEQGRHYTGNNQYLKAFYHFTSGHLQLGKDFTKMDTEYKIADSILDRLSTTSAYALKTNIAHDYALITQNNNEPEKTIDILINNVLPNAEKTKDCRIIGSTLVDIGITLALIKEYDKSLSYFKQGIETLKHSTTIQPSDLLNAYLKEANIYVNTEQPDSLKSLLDSAKSLLEAHPNIRWNVEYLFIEGCYFSFKSQYDKALNSLQQGSEMIDKNNLKEILKYPFWVRQYNIFAAIGNYKKAKELLLKVLNNNEFILTEDRLNYYSELANIYYKLGNTDSAYYIQKTYSNLNDSLYKTHRLDEINKLETKFRTSEKEKQILNLQNQKSSAELSAKTNKLYAVLLGAGCFILLLAAIFSYIVVNNNKNLSIQKEINHHQQLKEIEQQNELKIAQAMLEGEERERARVARDLHDGLGGMLAGVKINLSGWANNHSAIQEDNALNKVVSQLDSSVNELRRIARNMMPTTLLRFGLLPALEELCDFYRNDKLKIEFQHYNVNEQFALPIQLNIYRIIQELLSNAVKHAQADNIVLQSSQNENMLFITVEDNGKGFDASKISIKKGMGLSNIQNRVKYLKGFIDIISSYEGTTINIEFPIDESS